MEPSPSMILGKSPILPSPKIDNHLINTLMRFGTFSGFQKAKGVRDRLLSRSVLTVELLSGQ